MPVTILGAFAAIHSVGYLKHHGHGRLGIYWFFYNLMIASMILVPLSATPVTFLFCWEIMGLTSFALVAYEYHSRETMKAAWIYLLACHAGIAFLIPMFMIHLGIWQTANATLWLFLTGAIGFGLKAGLPGLHVWLPEAHPAAPAPVSSVMSGAMINLGIFGILTYAVKSNDHFLLYGYFLLICGIIGAFGGAVSAYAQQNLKRLLACSSVENIGIICMGLGFGFLGFGYQNNFMAVCGFTGAFLHILNHAVLKGTLFLAAGEVYRSTGTLNMDLLGGLMKRIPGTGRIFTLAGLSLSGLPPFNAFPGEFAIYLAGFAGLAAKSTLLFVISLAGILGLAVTGGVVCGVFAKAIGGTFLGEPRSSHASEAEKTPVSIFGAMTGLISLAVIMLVATPVMTLLLRKMPEMFLKTAGNEIAQHSNHLAGLMLKLTAASGIVLIFFIMIWLLRYMLLTGKSVEKGPTWDCGYAEPTARMEYTATSFARPLCKDINLLSCFKKHEQKPDGLFPESASVTVTAEDPATAAWWKPLFEFFGKIAEKVHRLQSGSLHWYILMMVIAVLAMLIWGFVFQTDKTAGQKDHGKVSVKKEVVK